ncbi:MAG: DUF5713 family protein [Chitinophagaceae bacterium]
MNSNKLPDNFEYLKEMYEDGYFPTHLVDKIKASIKEVVSFIEEGGRSIEEIQTAFDKMTHEINDLQDEFVENGSEIETAARESIGATVDNILKHFEIDIDTEEAIRERDW